MSCPRVIDIFAYNTKLDRNHIREIKEHIDECEVCLDCSVYMLLWMNSPKPRQTSLTEDQIREFLLAPPQPEDGQIETVFGSKRGRDIAGRIYASL